MASPDVSPRSVIRRIRGSRRAKVALILAAVVLALGNNLVPSSSGPIARADDATIDGYLDAQFADIGYPGASVAIVRDGRVEHVHAFGHADETGRPVTVTTPFTIGSLSKSITAMAVLRLVDGGSVELDAPVVRYVPSFATLDRASSPRITVRQLLNQTSGIAPNALTLASTPTTLDGEIGRLASVAPVAAPGATFAYSNANYVVLGRVIETVTRKPFAAAVRDLVFTPLGMTHSAADLASAERLGLGDAHKIWFGIADTRRPLFREDFMPAGFVASTAEDMAKAIEMILANGVVSGRPFLSSASVAVLTTGTGPANVTGARYAMGWNEQDRDGVRTLVHDGSTTDMASFQGIVPAAGTGLVLLADAQSIPFELMGKIDFVGLGALDQMIGRAPRGTLDHFYPAVDAFLVILFGLMIRGLVLQVRKIGRGEQPRRRGPVRRGSVLALWTYLDVFVPFAILTNGPLFLGADWSVLVRTDVGLVLALIAAIRIADGGLRLVGWSVSHRSPAPRGVVEPVVAPTP